MLQKIGFFVMCIGATLANSDCLLIPLAVVGFGAFLIWNGLGEEV